MMIHLIQILKKDLINDVYWYEFQMQAYIKHGIPDLDSLCEDQDIMVYETKDKYFIKVYE
jgi:hypothetical protein